MSREPGPAAAWRGEPGRRLFWLAHGFLFLVSIVPFFAAGIAPLGDWPNHLARIHILAAGGRDPALAANYAVRWAVLPNLGIEAVAWPLTRLVGLIWAGRLFLILTFLALVGGVIALSAAWRGRPGWATLGVYLVLYNLLLHWGYVAYLFGVGLAFLVFAPWLRHREDPTIAAMAAFGLAGAGLYLAQLGAFAVFGLMVAGHEAGRLVAGCRLRRGDVGRLLLVFGPATLLWLATPVWHSEVGTFYGGAVEKLDAALSPVLFSFGHFDFLVLGSGLAALVVGVLGGGAALARPAWPPLLLMLGVAALLPNWLWGIYGVDFRLPLVIVCLFLAALQWRPPNRWFGVATLAVIAGVVAGRAWTTAETFAELDRQYDEFRAASRLLPAGSRLLTVKSVTGLDPALRRAPLSAYSNLAALAVIERGVFYAPMLTSVQPLRPAPRNAAIDSPHGHAITAADLAAGADPAAFDRLAGWHDRFGHNAYWIDWPHRFDAALWLHFGAPIDDSSPHLVPIHDGTFFRLYRIEPGSGGAPAALGPDGRDGIRRAAIRPGLTDGSALH